MSDETKKKLFEEIEKLQEQIPDKKCRIIIELYEGGVKGVAIEAKLK